MVDVWQRHLSHADMAGGIAAIEVLLAATDVEIEVRGPWSDE